MTNRQVPADLAGFGLISTLVALFVTQPRTDGLNIDGLTTWVPGTLAA